jgi:3-oxoacyl-[acyl-carrier-protein] synthase II
MDREPCRPFDQSRKGLSLGECGAMLVLEELEHAKKRKAPIYAEFLDYGCSSDAHHMTTPHPDGTGAKISMANALSASGVRVEEIDYINAHGTGTKLNDITECKAIQQIFIEKNPDVPVSSNKSYIGHCLGAAGAVEAVFSILSLKNGIIPATLRLEERDDACRVNIIGNRIIDRPVRCILSNSFGFGGNNTSIIIRKWED